MLAANTLLQGRYRIIRPIGQGGMGAVYEAKDERLGCTVALKQTLMSGGVHSQAFEREARILAQLRHPALPKRSWQLVLPTNPPQTNPSLKNWIN
jgi:serine/threonine protein kinase